MRQMFSNATVAWDEQEIVERETLIQQVYQKVHDEWLMRNPRILFRRVETPILTPEEHLESHRQVGFPLLSTDRGLLRPETTAGCIEALYMIYPMEQQLQKALPVCIWQVGKSFRDEDKPQTMRASKLRLREFWQMEFQLFTAHNTKSDYLEMALNPLAARFGGEIVEPDELPHYSEKTLDWEIDGLEVAGCSVRTDWPDGKLYEISIGLDRLLVKVLRR